ncbi:acyl-CoA dehydrogenase family protein [Sphingomonas bacterium]|uniref:acyl-CoA dehydrogenase family protein n=1 Tax=Sphingomonas bacterium TaxID=1895847 RepID=UPI001576752E|nr:acyl-CoA dehydrogenase [Sphingomonas bacterium]
MNFEPSDDQKMIADTFARYLDEHSSIARVRKALPFGFDAELWRGLGEMGAFAMRVPEADGGLGLSLLDAALLMEEAGRTLVSGPLAEAIVAGRLLALIGDDGVAALAGRAATGDAVLTLALNDAAEEPLQWIAGGAVADAVIARDGDSIVMVVPSAAEKAAAAERASPEGTRNHAGEPIAPNLASMPITQVRLDAADRTVLATGPEAVARFAAAIEEWKLLTAATLAGIGREAVRLAAVYASERKAFGQPIGTYQAISHPLADLAVEADGGKYLVWKTIRDIADGVEQAGAQVSMALWWNAKTAGAAGSQALHTFGGYGLTNEYDIYLYNLRARALPMLLGDPEEMLAEAGRRLYQGEQVSLPDVGEVSIDFDLGDEAHALAAEVDAFFTRTLTPELKAKAHYSYAGHDDYVHKRLAEENLLFPGWSKEYGGREASPYALSAVASVWEDHGWSSHAAGTSSMVGWIMQRFGTDDLKEEALARVVAGDAVCSLGFSEPGSGSDVFAAATRATPDGNGWRINGSKMFTSGANFAEYVLLLARTNFDVPKHKGLTMFIVPLKSEGVEIQPVYTFQDERTNITYYDNVYIPDSYRLGPVDGGVRVMAASLELEHGASFVKVQRHMLHEAETFCRETIRKGTRLIEREDTVRRLARAAVHIELSTVIYYRALWASVEKREVPAAGPASKMFSSEKFLKDAADLLNLSGQAGLAKDGSAGFLNLSYRHAHGTTIYGGTSEVHRSMIAERQLGMPRTRS